MTRPQQHGVQRVVAITAGAVLAWTAVTAAAPPVMATASADPAPPRVTGFSKVLDGLQTGLNAGPPVLLNTATSVLYVVAAPSNLPEGFGGDFSQLLAVTNGAGQGMAEVQKQGSAGIGQLRTVIAPMAAGNQHANQAIDVLTAALDQVATDQADTIQPADRTLHQVATLIRGAKE